jgi:hypothetical protein
MKNLKILFLSFLVGFLFIACEGEDDSLSPATNYLLGTWELREIGGLNNSNILNYESIIPEGTCGFDTFAFLPNNTFTFTEYTSDIETSCDSYIDSGIYEMNVLNVDITFTAQGETVAQTINATIETLNLNTLILTYSDNGEIVFLKFSKI